MTDLISRSALCRAIEKSRINLRAYKDRLRVSDIERMIVIALAIDAVPVVRCKSCMKRSTFECPMYSEIDGSDYGLGIIINDRTNDDGYCHCGARMDAKEDTDGSQTD